ncbi:MAG: 16S rRNA (guanine(527)-N(7))-methyltransferase RsmG [Deltaproteobacteria bacterium]|jgi:16S rRNA (guanine527-N7)-methyltransferase|nr:16S rRNA (guanine(527)-N(7))-methyltransferase RsmG [Deltaproteobacteria bacterium]
MIEDAKKFFKESLERLNIYLDSLLIDKIFMYFTDLLEKNKSVNLISRQSVFFDSIVVHLVDSLTPMQIELPQNIELLDFGSGGGLPGIPLILANPTWKAVLAESKAKKSVFLQEMADKYGNGKISVLTEFLDSKNRNIEAQRSFFDIVTARAVDKLHVIATSVTSLIKVGGLLIAYKGPNYAEELKKAEKFMDKCGLIFERKLEFSLPTVDAKRTLLFFRKES